MIKKTRLMFLPLDIISILILMGCFYVYGRRGIQGDGELMLFQALFVKVFFDQMQNIKEEAIYTFKNILSLGVILVITVSLLVYYFNK